MLSTRRKFLMQMGVSGAAVSFGSRAGLFARMRGPGEIVSGARLAADPLRPQFHLLPARNWMNDPDGPIYWRGQYHMFFQYNPNAAVWGDMHWAHATSPDMLHWKHQPIALAPTPGGYDSEGCFSGSAVNDKGTATFLYTGVKNVPPTDATLRDGTHNFLEVQCLATSADPGLRKWDKLAAPVLLPPRGMKLTGFRDPCLWQEGKFWYLGVGSGQTGLGGMVLLFRSTDLRHWEYLHPLASGKKNTKLTSDPVDSGEMWECPDFFALGKKHVLLYSTERKVYWETGELDPQDLVFHPQKRGLLDLGTFYAPKSQLDAKGQRILWGWITETRPAAEFSAAGWAGCMSLPRVLSIGDDDELRMQVLPGAAELRGKLLSLTTGNSSSDELEKALARMELSSATAELELHAKTKPFQLNLTDGTNDIVRISYDPTRTGRELQMGKEFASLPPTNGSDLRLHLFLDGSVVECMIDDRAAWTTRTYQVPVGPLHFKSPEARGDSITSLNVWPIRPISADRLTT